MDIIKAKPISFAQRNTALNVNISQPYINPRGQYPTNVDKAKYVLCSNLMGTSASAGVTNAAYIITATSDLALPTAQVRITFKVSNTTYDVASSITGVTPNPTFPDDTSQLNKVVRKGVGALKDTNGNDITITSWTRTGTNLYRLVTSAAISASNLERLFFGDITGSLKTSTLLPHSEELIIEKEPTDLIYGSNGINGNQAIDMAGRIVFTKVNRIRID